MNKLWSLICVCLCWQNQPPHLRTCRRQVLTPLLFTWPGQPPHNLMASSRSMMWATRLTQLQGMESCLCQGANTMLWWGDWTTGHSTPSLSRPAQPREQALLPQGQSGLNNMVSWCFNTIKAMTLIHQHFSIETNNLLCVLCCCLIWVGLYLMSLVNSRALHKV